MKIRRILMSIVVISFICVLSQPVVAGQSVFQLAETEVAYLKNVRKLDIPDYSLSTFNWFKVEAFTIINKTPQKYNVALKNWYYGQGQTEFWFDHEIGHVMLDKYNQTQDEGMADYFAYCFGSENVRKFFVNYRGVKIQIQINVLRGIL